MNNKKPQLCTIICKVCAVCAACLVILAAGCESAGKESVKDRIDALTRQNAELTYQFKQSEAENEQIRKQLQVLAGLQPDVRLKDLYTLQQVKITRFTNLYDKNEDGVKEKLIVYLQPVDEQGDIIKATGAVDVQLWDLSDTTGQALLAQWQVEPDELKKLWFATLITTNYRLTFDVADIVGEFDRPLTVKVTFTDYLTGKVFTEQELIEPR